MGGAIFVILVAVLLFYLNKTIEDFFDNENGLCMNDKYQNAVIDAYNSIDESDTKDSVQRKLCYLKGVDNYLFDGIQKYEYDGEVIDAYCYRWLLNWNFSQMGKGLSRGKFLRACIIVYFDKEYRCIDKDHLGVDSPRSSVIEE